MEMECLYCKGELVPKRISYAATRRGYHLIIDAVPAWVCTLCGEPLFDEETVDAIQEVLRGVDTRLGDRYPRLSSKTGVRGECCLRLTR
jgi:YgiT-type zinc finger domain-containing protein